MATPPGYSSKKASPRVEREPDGELTHIHIEPLGNGEGVISHSGYSKPASGQGGGPARDVSEEKHHHPTLEHLVNHFKEHLKTSFEPTNESETDGYEHEPSTEAE